MGGGGDHMNERFPCAVCGKSYLRKRHLQRHMRDECIGIPPRFSCDLCPSRFRRKYHMVRHLTSKHSIPLAIAQQTTTSNRSGGGGSSNASNFGTFDCNASVGSGCDSPLPENLSMRKEYYENENSPSPVAMLNMPSSQACGAGGGGSNVNNNTTSGSASVSPIPPKYGLTGAITAITAAAALVEESANNNKKNIENGGGETTAADEATAAAALLLDAANIKIKGEPVSPTKAAVNMMDDDWKMKLSLQLISNSLLKERLMNSMPFAYNNN